MIIDRIFGEDWPYWVSFIGMALWPMAVAVEH